MTFPVGTKVRFRELYRPPQVRWAATGIVVDLEVRPRRIPGRNTGSALASAISSRLGSRHGN
jgi:hypothetical protein